MDDGKANAVSHGFIDNLNQGLDRAEAESKAVVLQGRPGVFSAGFDLKEIGKGPAKRGTGGQGHIVARLFSCPMPVVAASAGHMIAASAIDVGERYALRCLGAKYGLNETAIGMTLPPLDCKLLCAGFPSAIKPKRLSSQAVRCGRGTACWL